MGPQQRARGGRLRNGRSEDQRGPGRPWNRHASAEGIAVTLGVAPEAAVDGGAGVGDRVP